MATNTKKSAKSTLDRRVAVRAILAERGDSLLVTGLGSSCYDAGTMDHPLSYYLWGGMGGATMIGVGMALAQPKRRTLVITGDGEMLMGLGSLATIGAEKISNLSVIVIDNELYSETGMQPTHTSRGSRSDGAHRPDLSCIHGAAHRAAHCFSSAEAAAHAARGGHRSHSGGGGTHRLRISGRLLP